MSPDAAESDAPCSLTHRELAMPLSVTAAPVTRHKLSKVLMTVTLKVCVAVLLDVSVAVEVTVVVPMANVEPDGGLQLTVTGPGALSVAVGRGYVATAPAGLVASSGPMSACVLVKVGGTSSMTVEAGPLTGIWAN